MKQIQDAYIVAATRTPVGKAPKGVFRNTRPDDMLAHVLNAVIAQAPGIDVNRIEDAIIGCAMPEGEQGMNVARIGVLLAGPPHTTAAPTTHRFCSSPPQPVAPAAAATRTPVGKAPKGVFRNTRPDDMLAHVLNAVIAQAPGIDVNRIEDAIIGCAMPEGEQGMNVARIGVLLAGLPNTIAAQTINRFCSSGLQAVALAADQIRLGNSDLMLAGGTESMSMVPMMGNKVALSPNVFKDDHVAIAYGMGITAEKVAEEWKVSREDQDAFALGSHQKALAAIKAGEFRDEISPYEVVSLQPDLGGNTLRLTKLLELGITQV